MSTDVIHVAKLIQINHYARLMSDDADDGFQQHRLRAIGALLNVGPEFFSQPQSNDRLIELLRAWSDLPGEAAQEDVLAYMRLVARGLLK